MKWLKRILVALVALAILAWLGAQWYTYQTVPPYEGEQSLNGLSAGVDVTFDAHGIPHIQAKNRLDAFRTLGYLMASERLFQMEMLRRLGTGRMAEVFGERGLEADVFFHTAGIASHAKKSADAFLQDEDETVRQEVRAFLEGVNSFIETGVPPLEFTLAEIPMTPYDENDLFGMAAYLAYSFSLGIKTDVLAHELSRQHSPEWLIEMGLIAGDLPPFNPMCSPDDSLTFEAAVFKDFPETFGVPTFIGSNSWAVSGAKTASGKPMLCNDTHIGYSLPQVWYEAAIDCPDFNFYGNFLPGIPYALVGHSERHGWGLTMFENDDVDLYRERTNEDGHFLYGDSTYKPVEREVRIAVKDREDTSFVVQHSLHGPIINGAVEALPDFPPVAMYWEYTQGDNHLIRAFRQMSLAGDLEQFQEALPLIHAPGLNVIYADRENNIGWWSCARIPEHPDHIMPKTIIDGSYPENDPKRYRDFSRNPQCVNPERGFVASANELADLPDSNYVYGYYVPPTRGKRIRRFLAENDTWDTDGMKQLITDAVNEDDARLAVQLRNLLEPLKEWNPTERVCLDLLDWDGGYNKEDRSAVIWQPLQVALLEKACEDEMTPEQWERFSGTHWMKRLMQLALGDPQHKIWDIRTTPETESLGDLAPDVFTATCEKLAAEFGNDPATWTWERAHYFQPRHPLADVPVVGGLFVPKELAIAGGNETINQSGILMDAAPRSFAKHGAQMRIIIDFAQVDSSVSISPCGQSGHPRSPYFYDQGPLYASGLFRPQHMNAMKGGSVLKFTP